MNIQLPAEVRKKVATIALPTEVERGLQLCRDGMQALSVCETIEYAKYWSDKSDALAAWAKIHQSLEIDVQARRLKLVAYREMGRLAALMRPTVSKGRLGASPGPQSLLVETGLSRTDAQAARRMAMISQDRFDAIVSLPRPPSPKTAAMGSWVSAQWQAFHRPAGTMRSFCRSQNAAELARLLSRIEAEKAREMVCELTEWLDEFEQHLPKQ